MRVLELHAPVQVVQRSQGRTATAAAAYRSGTKIVCERTGIIHDYTRKKGIEETAMLLPDDAPDWAHDRATLWNKAEKREVHPRAQTAREVQVAFPAEFSPEQRKKAGLQIGQWIVARYGAAADLAWHEPSAKGDQRNHHAHILFTTRRFENGEWAKTKDRTLDDLKKGPEEVVAMRAAVADILNDIAVREDLGIYVEHLSFETRGLDREATQHLGPNASEMERRGVATDIGNHNRAVAVRNQQREKLYQEKKATEKPRQAEEEMPSRPLVGFHPAAWAPLYADAAKRRRAMLDEQDRRYGEHEKELRKRIAGLHASIDHKNSLVRSWRHIIGRTRQEKDEVRSLMTSYDRILEEKRVAQVQFENDRRARSEQMKASFRRLETKPSSSERTNPAKTRYTPKLSPEEFKAANDLLRHSGPAPGSDVEKRETFTQKQGIPDLNDPLVNDTRFARREQQPDNDIDHEEGPEHEWG